MQQIHVKDKHDMKLDLNKLGLKSLFIDWKAKGFSSRKVVSFFI